MLLEGPFKVEGRDFVSAEAKTSSWPGAQFTAGDATHQHLAVRRCVLILEALQISQLQMKQRALQEELGGGC